ncbi:extracellular solute-binding protein [Vallitalea okinawensis]|uniref:extracellular solute-binding protein n=1 Tax=Vallitalea okinawensis TaxID=2078660 RepID=UPI000CFC85A4|nr:extracellular solute-binding protein [Vallitalea okinawensis]
MKRVSRGLRSIVAFMLSISLISTMLVGCGAGDNSDANTKSQENVSKDVEEETKVESDVPDYMNATGYPIVNEPITIKVVSTQTPVQAHFDDTVSIPELEKITGIHVDWELVPWSAANEKKNLMLASGDYPDVFLRMFINSLDVITYGSQQSTFIQLDDLIEQYAPNFNAIAKQYPIVKNGLKAPDGGIYALPRIIDPSFTSMLSGDRLYMRQDWLEDLGLEEPTNANELYTVLKAFKEQDPNGNGQADEIPFYGMNLGNLMNNLYGSWGLMNRGKKHTMVDMNEETGELRFIAADENYRDMLNYLNKLYSEDLIAEELFTSKWKDVVANVHNGAVGSYGGFAPIAIGTDINYQGMNALEGPFGDQSYSSINPPLSPTFMVAITDKNEYPEATMRWLDFMYSEEGIRLFDLGIEGETYEVNEGKYEYMDIINKNPNGLSVAEARNQLLPSVSGWVSVTKQEYFKGSEASPEALAAAEKTTPYHIEEVWPEFIYTTDETDQLRALKSDIDSYVAEIRAKVIIGDYVFDDEGWDKYTKTLFDMGLDEYMTIYKAAYERYENNK